MTLQRTVDEIVVGPGELYLAPFGTAFPANPTVEPAALFREIGYSENGWTLEADKTFEDIFVAEEIDPVATFKTAQTIRITGEMAQISLINLRLSFGGGEIETDSPAPGFDTYTPPPSDEYEELAALFRTKAAPGVTEQPFLLRDWRFPRVVAAGAVSSQYTKAPQKALISTEFRALLPPGEDARIFTIVDQAEASGS